jgi:type IV secretion system protein VirB10
MTGADLAPAQEAPTPEPPLDRGVSPIAGRLTSGQHGKALAFAGLLAGCGVFAFASWSADRPKPEKAPEQPARQVVAFEPAKPPPTLAHPGDGPPGLTGSQAIVPAIEPASSDTPPAPSAASGRASPIQQMRAAPVMAYSRGAAKLDPGPPDGRPIATGLPAAANGTDLDRLRQGSKVRHATARRLGDRNFLILAGATLPCVLQTALDSSTSGYATCLIGSDVYSDNGAVVLLDKGTRVLGEYRGGLRQGQRRIFVLWTRAVTPDGVAIDLSSPAADALGRGGFDGALDTHFWDRFGAALLLSIVDGGASAIAGRNDGGAVTRLPSDAAGVAVQNSAEIAPTLRKVQGSEVTIMAAQDFDFSGVYGLKARAP